LHNPTSYLIFWLPTGYSFDNPVIDPTATSPSNSNYESIITRYFQAVGNTAFFNILQQYPDSSGAPGTTAVLGGTWIDNSSYPGGRGSTLNPLQDSDIQNEVSRAMSVNGWSTGSGSNEFFVFTGYSVFSCAGPSCNFGTNGLYCAYHSAFGTVAQPVIYANMPDPGSLCSVSGFTSRTPNNDLLADSEVNLISHEEFESISDPYSYIDSMGNYRAGWYFGDTGHEIGDECAWQFGTLAADGSNVVLNGARFIVQEEWSNAASGCYLPPVSVTLRVGYTVLGGGTGYGPPSLHYTSGGVAQTSTVGASPSAYSLDIGTSWSLDTKLPGSSSTELWQTDQGTGLANTAQTITVPYFHQYVTSFSFSVSGGGSGYAQPGVTISQFGATMSYPASPSVAGAVAVDAGSQYAFPSLLQGSSTLQRWFAASATGTISSPSPVVAAYYHQYPVSLSYSILDGGNPGPPTFTSAYAGASLAQTVAQQQAVWADSGSSYSLGPTLSGSTATERWQTNVTATGTISNALTVSLTYYHQYFESISYSIAGGGTASAPTLSYTAFGTPATSPPGTFWGDSGTPFTFDSLLAGSSQTERWQTNSATAGTVTSSSALAVTFYHQYMVSASYSVSGGGAPLPPSFTFDLFGASSLQSLGVSSQSFWADSGPYSFTDPLGGSTATERWSAPNGQGSIGGPGTISEAYAHQFLLAVQGGALPPSEWYNSSSTAGVNEPGVFGRGAGAGQRVTSYGIDGNPQTPVTPTAGTIPISIMMNSAHSLLFDSVSQYQVSLDPFASQALSSITPPTISGDNYWYDANSPVSVALNGVWGRAAGTGSRLLSFSVNGAGQTEVSSTSPTSVLSLASISSPQSIVATPMTQFFLNASLGSLNSITGPSIPGDAGWYDLGTSVASTYNHSWDLSGNQSRLNAISYSIDGVTSLLPREGSGTFTVTTNMSQPRTLTIESVTQFRFAVDGGHNPLPSLASPTQDGYFDSGTSLSVTTPYVWNIVNGNSRENLVGYSLDGTAVNITRDDTGNFTSPTITFDSFHKLTFNQVEQYLVSFNFTDSTGQVKITPNALQINIGGRLQNIAGFNAWLDNSTTFSLARVSWEGADVKPLTSTTYTANLPLNLTVPSRIFTLDLKVSDLVRAPISGARVNLVLANGSAVSGTTASDGSIIVPLVPLGNFSGSISYLGVSTQVSGDASQGPAHGRVIASPDDLALFGAIAAISVGVGFGILRARRPKTSATSKRPR